MDEQVICLEHLLLINYLLPKTQYDIHVLMLVGNESLRSIISIDGYK